MTIAEQHQRSIELRAELRGTPTEGDRARALARHEEEAATLAVLDQDDLNNGRAPRPDNAQVAVRLTDRAQGEEHL